MSAFLLWVSIVLGVRLDPDGHYGNQCVDAVDHYGQFLFGVPWQECVGGVAGAKQLLDAAPDEYWTRIDYYHGFIPQAGDVLVYGGDPDNPWGHTAVTVDATNTYINAIQQDGFAAPHQYVDGNWYSAKPAHRARLAYSAPGTGKLLGVLRPRPEKITAGAISYQSTTTAPTPPKEGPLMALTDQQQNDIYWILCTPDGRQYLSDLAGAGAARHTLNAPIQRGGAGAGIGDGLTSLGAMVAWNDAHTIDLMAVAAAEKSGASIEDIKTAMLETLASGVVTVDVDVNLKGKEG